MGSILPHPSRRGALSAQLGTLTVSTAAPVRIAGVINVGKGSFYRASVVNRTSALLRRAQSMVAAGAELIDIGARSTAPYLTDLTSEDEEASILAEAVRAVAAAITVPVSADTPRAGPLAAAIAAGATVANDVSGLADPHCAELIAKHGLGLILMPDLAQPFPPEPLPVVQERLALALSRAAAAGIDRSRIVIDPGIGFFRSPDISWYDWDCAVIQQLAELESLGRPVLIGISRKSFVGAILGQPDPQDRLLGSLAATAIAVANGVAAVRTHDVAATLQVVRVAERLKRQQ